jgi:hypothetical protein
VSTDNSTVSANAQNKVLIGSGADVTGYDGLDVAARFTGVDTFAYSYAEVIGLFGYLESNPTNNTVLASSVVAAPPADPAQPAPPLKRGKKGGKKGTVAADGTSQAPPDKTPATPTTPTPTTPKPKDETSNGRIQVVD